MNWLEEKRRIPFVDGVTITNGAIISMVLIIYAIGKIYGYW